MQNRNSKVEGQLELNLGTDEQLQMNLSTSKIEKELIDLMKILRCRYQGCKARRLIDVFVENKDLPINKIDMWVNGLYGKSAKEYLIEEGILSDSNNKLKKKHNKSDEESLGELISVLKERYDDHPAVNLNQVVEENPNLPIHKINSWTKKLFNKTAKKYLIDEGVIQAKDGFFVHVEKEVSPERERIEVLSQRIKLNKSEINKGNFEVFNTIQLKKTEKEQVSKLKETFEILGEDIVALCQEKRQDAKYLMLIAKDLHESLELELFRDKHVNNKLKNIPQWRREKLAKVYIECFAQENRKDHVLTEYCSDNASIYDFINETKSKIDEQHFDCLLRFCDWCSIEYSALMNDFYSGMRHPNHTKIIIETRSKGGTLEDTGKKLNVTRERIRQLENKIKLAFEKKYNSEHIVNLISADRDGDGVISLEEAEMYCGKELVYILKGTSTRFNDELKVFCIAGNISLDGVKKFVNDLPEQISVENLENKIQVFCDKESIEKEFVTTELEGKYRRYGKILSKTRLPYGKMYALAINEIFPEGIHIYDETELAKLKQYIKEEFDTELQASDRAIIARIADVTILAGRGIYRAKKDNYMPKSLKKKIHNYIVNNDTPIFLTSAIFNRFEEELKSVGITNRYYLHGILGELFGDEFFFKRDYVYKDKNANSLYDEIIEYIRKKEYPVAKEEIANHFGGITDIIITLAVADENILNYFGLYLHSSRLHLMESDREYFKCILNACLSDRQSHHVKDIYDIVVRDNVALLERLGIESSFSLFSIINYLFKDEYELSRPYIGNIGIELSSTREKLDELIHTSNEISLAKIQELARDNHYQINSILNFVNEYNNTHFLVDRDNLKKISLLGVNQALSEHIEELILKEINGTVQIGNLECLYQLKPINVDWNEWLIYSMLQRWSTKLEVAASNTQLRFAAPLVAKTGTLEIEMIDEADISLSDTFIKTDDLSEIDELIADYIDIEMEL